ncbi:MAG: hypothetical protein AAGF84_11540 [Planctomycetota bacterium]
MDETQATPAPEASPEAPQTGENAEAVEGGLPEETVRLLLEEWNLDPAVVEWLQKLAADAPAEVVGYLVASTAAGLIPALIAFIIPLIVFITTYLILAAVLALLIWLPHRQVPRKLRRIHGFSIWLTVIPFFGLLWNFRVASRVPASFRNYFAAHPEAIQPPPGMVGGAPLNVGSAGKPLGMWYAGLTIAAWLTLITCILSPLSTPLSIASIVLYILFVVKLFQMSGRVAEHKNAPPAPPTNPTPPTPPAASPA